MSFFNRLYLSTFLNAFGSWLTFLALALITQSLYGSQYVALVFLAQTIPAILLSRSLANVVPKKWHRQVYLSTQVVLAINSLVLVYFKSLPVIFSHLIVASILKSLANPLLNTLIGSWVASDRQKEVLTRIGALQAGTLAIAPLAGAWLKIAFSSELLFTIDAITFVVSILLLKELFSSESAETAETNSARLQWRDFLAGVSYKPKNIPPETWHALRLWFLFLGVGAILNAIEFPGFSLNHMSEQQIGYALAAWGLGNLLAFFYPHLLEPKTTGTMYLLGITIFAVGQHPLIPIFAFFIAGLSSSYFSGDMRTRIQQSVPADQNAVHLWAYVNQITQLINLVAYGTAGLFLDVVGFHFFGAAMIGTAAMLGILTATSVAKIPIQK